MNIYITFSYKLVDKDKGQIQKKKNSKSMKKILENNNNYKIKIRKLIIFTLCNIARTI